MKRPECIRHWRDVEGADDATYPDSNERFLLARRWPANWVSAALVFTMNGCRPDAAHLIRMRKATKRSLFTFWRVTLRPDQWLFMEARTRRQRGISSRDGCHTFINNTDEEVRLLVVGEANKNITVSTIRSIRCMPRRAKTAGSTIRLSFGPHDGKPGRK